MAEARDDRLRLLVERIERLMEEKRGIAEDIKDVFAEAKAVGYDTRVLRTVIARRAMKPDDRIEADAMVETYEAALGGFGPDPAVDPDEARRELAIALLDEQVEGIRDPVQAALLAEHVAVLLDLRAEIKGLREMERARLALAKGEGFEPNPIKAVVRWIEKCAKKGREAMRAGEAIYQLYRGTVEGRGVAASIERATADPTLQKALGGSARSKAAARNSAWLETGMGD